MNVSVSQFKQTVAQVLQNRQREEVRSPDLVPAAVLLALYEKEGRIHLPFTRRTDRVAYHKAQISFPWGAKDPTDPTLLHTALRESVEEVGLDPTSVEILGVLDDTLTVASRFVITPFVGFLNYPPRFTINQEEVAEIIEVPLEVLLNNCTPREEHQFVNGQSHRVYFYEYSGHTIWGATARVLKRFLELLCPALPPAPIPQHKSG